MKKVRFLIICTILALAVIGGAPFMSIAEESTKDQGSNDYVLDEVSVTSTKREMKIQDVPQSVSALTGSYMQELGYDNIDDFVLSVPGLELTNIGPGKKKVVMRGINSFAGAALVGEYFNEIPITGDSIAGTEINTYDLERVEFLKGPQGTLYGEGAVGGAVRYITRKPNLENTEVSIQLNSAVTAHSDDLSSGFDAMFNLPLLKDKFGVRVVGSYRDTAGFLDNDLTGKEDANTIESFNGRFSALFTPTDALKITGIAYLSDQEADGYFAGNPDTLSYSRNDNDYSDIDYKVYDLTVNYDLKWAEFTSATGYLDQENDGRTDFIEQVALANGMFAGLIGAGFMPSIDEVFGDRNTQVEIFSQEFRLVSSTESPLQWTTGVFYRKKEISGFEKIGSSPFIDFGAIAGGAIFPAGTEVRQITDSETYEQYAVFGELEYDIVNNLKAIVGGRYSIEDVNFKSNSYGLLLGSPDPSEDASPQDTDAEFKKFVPKFSLSYQASDDLLVYGTVSEGFRSGLINSDDMLQISGMTESDLSVDPESLWSYELGVKSTLMNGAMTLNAAVFYMDWSDRQVANSANVMGAPVNFTANIGEAHSMGLELDVSARLAEGLTVQVGGNIIEAEIDADTLAFSGAGGNSGIAPKGNKLPGTSPYKLFANVTYDFNITDNIWSIFNLSASFNGESHSSVLNEDFDKTSAYTIVDFSAAVIYNNWKISLLCSNLFDKTVGLTSDSNTPQGDRYFFMNRTRQIALTASYAF